MMARFFIDRPVLAWVISIIIVLMGLISAALCRLLNIRKSHRPPCA